MKSRITKIEIGRCYSCGNYENVTYRLTADIAEGDSAATVIVGMEKIIAGMAPVRGVRTESEIAHETARIGRMKKLTAGEWHRDYGHCAGSRAEVTARYAKDLVESINARKKALKLARNARALFNALSGAAQWKDAKLDWEDRDDY